jgi:hypothetical protein
VGSFKQVSAGVGGNLDKPGLAVLFIIEVSVAQSVFEERFLKGILRVRRYYAMEGADPPNCISM